MKRHQIAFTGSIICLFAGLAHAEALAKAAENELQDAQTAFDKAKGMFDSMIEIELVIRQLGVAGLPVPPGEAPGTTGAAVVRRVLTNGLNQARSLLPGLRRALSRVVNQIEGLTALDESLMAVQSHLETQAIELRERGNTQGATFLETQATTIAQQRRDIAATLATLRKAEALLEAAIFVLEDLVINIDRILFQYF
jgi:hypothetical protein